MKVKTGKLKLLTFNSFHQPVAHGLTAIQSSASENSRKCLSSGVSFSGQLSKHSDIFQKRRKGQYDSDRFQERGPVFLTVHWCHAWDSSPGL